MTCQCILCQYCVMSETKGKGLCWKEKQEKRKPRDVLERRECKLYRLGPMDSVKSRSQRRMVFDSNGIVRLV